MATPIKRRLFSDHYMATADGVVEIDSLEKGLLTESRDGVSGEDYESNDDTVLYKASFEDMEEKFVKYKTAQWVMYSLLLILAWGVGLFMLLYLPVRRYILRKDIRSRNLYLTPHAIVYKVTNPVAFPCFGVLKKEKHVLLPSVADIIIEQGYLQSLFGVYSLRIENVGVRRPPSDDVQIQGIANPGAFKKAVLTRLSYMGSEHGSRRVSTIEDIPSLRIGRPSSPLMSPSKSLRHDLLANTGDLMLLQKLEEVGNAVKKVQTFIEEQHSQS
ncbi:uncharacterized protein LOC110610918 [Manihot esculenta]|uniref:DUF7642 domain-containing protein n=3 Tax=Manihot esculenta TaxID=3983 RepID=A0A251L7N4_MANES|nr:uncharacterized protein LOC110610918 [Manihot esculenta]XP_043810603.1 uncharacterized protein LOC110610918 [Manihot esculenta]KAG8657153.1 hypothetical protein MANES_03G043800v8 [Manihot esculenta]OAY54041.1 hypothetical protein MANES_03G043800v8 [Manihot esculenta]OAY54042.1 hypothetical protein MANES_03G043800v8 [Manihot esculenta]